MLKVRLIPVMLMRHGTLVKSVNFKTYRPVGNPLNAIEFFNKWDVDEIIFLDITPKKLKDLGRRDDNYKRFKSLVDYTKYIAKRCFVPLTVGGGVNNIKQMSNLFNAGADKISVNTMAHKKPLILRRAAETFGRQSLVVSIDVKKIGSSEYEVITGYGEKRTGKDPIAWAKEVEKLGAGEIFLTSIDRDGMMTGYDISLVRKVADSVNIPVIASGGVGKWQHLVDGVKKGHASAVAAANIFHFTEQSTKKAKEFMHRAGVNVRRARFVDSL